MSMLTKAVVQSSRPRGRQAMTVIGLIVLTVIGTGLLLLQVQVRFAISDYRIETRKLQQKKERCLSDLNQLKNDVLALSTKDRAESAKQSLGMVATATREFETLEVDPERIEAWKNCRPEAVGKKPLISRLEVALEKTEAQAETIDAFWKILRPQVSKTQ